MLYFISGTVTKKDRQFAVIESHGLGFKLAMPAGAIRRLPKVGEEAKCFCALRVKDDTVELFGFSDEPSLKFFELLTTVNGVGPRTALAVLDLDTVERVTAAILEKRADLLLRASGIGRKTAERIILELGNRLELEHASRVAENLSVEVEVEEALVGLGYSRHEARDAAHEAGKPGGAFETQLRDALKRLGTKKQP